MSKVTFEETRVQLSFSYNHTLSIEQEDGLLDMVCDVKGFSAREQQKIGCGCLPHGFIIFSGDRLPTFQESETMKASIQNAIKSVKKRFK